MSASTATAASYAQWVREVVRRSAGGRRLVTLFDSSVPEPTELLRALVAEAFAPPLTSRYASAFAGGNPFVLDQLTARYGVPRDQVLCTTGATGALSLVYRTLLAPGDRVLVERPGFDLFTELALREGADVGYFDRSPRARYALDIAAIERALRPGTRLVVLSDLHNPSGVALGEEALKALAAFADRHDFHVVVDEVYGDYADRAVRPRAAASYSPRLLTISSLTKIFGLGTLRCGWIVAAPAVMASLREHADREEFGVSNLAHAVAALVLERADQFRAYADGVLAPARLLMADRLRSWREAGLVEGDMPPFGCICFPRLVGIEDTSRFADELMERAGVVVAPGEFFGAPGHVRIGFAHDVEVLRTGLDLLGDSLRRAAPPVAEERRAAGKAAMAIGRPVGEAAH